MRNYIMVGCDLHDKDIALRIAEGREEPARKLFWNTEGGRGAMIKYLQKRAEAVGGAAIVVAYEASSLGFGLYDELTDAGMRCHVLAPSKIERSPKQKKRKYDDADAMKLLEAVRGHILAGNTLPSIWIPDHKTRDDREVVRMRLRVQDRVTALKAQTVMLLKRSMVKKPTDTGENWSAKHRAWLEGIAGENSYLRSGARCALQSLLRQLKTLEEEVILLQKQVEELCKEARYTEPVADLMKLKGVGHLTALVYLTEMGDLGRFHNRRQVAAYLGIVPSLAESGEHDDRKGHITHQGPARVRRVLCQASWARVQHDEGAQKFFSRIADRNPKHNKIALVAVMRRLGIRMWDVGLKAQQRAGCFAEQKDVA